MKKIISAFACLILIIQVVFARKDIYTSGLPITGTALQTSQTLNTSVWYGFPSVYNNVLLYKTKSLNSYLKLFLNTENIPAGLPAFTATINCTFTYYIDGSNAATPVAVTKTLTVNYDPALGVKYKNVDVAIIENAYKLQINFSANSLQTSIPQTAQLLNFISLQAFTEHERFYNFMGIFTTPYTVNYAPAIVANYNTTDREVTLTFNNPIKFEEGYELEYTFVDDYGNNGFNQNFISSNQLNFSFKNNSTRILLEGNTYTIPVVQEHGYLLYRIRCYGIGGNDLDRIFFADFPTNTGGNNPDQMFTVANFPNKLIIDNTKTHTGDSINWQSVTTFAEEGKSKTVVKYMDGTSRMRQTVTSTSTERNAIVAETIYDRQGRAAVNILPSPVGTAAIKYYKNFNVNTQGNIYSSADFDSLSTNSCGNFSIHPLGTTSGAGNYYSAANPNKTRFNAFIPEANGYPFTRVTYMPDATDRVVRQGNVGEIFQPGKTDNFPTYQKHDTKYFYGKPDQAKLDYLFGTNVGYAQFYQKNLVVDPNGQASVSYVDLDGKTIATALAGLAPQGIEPLRSNTAASFNVDLLSGSDIVNQQDHSITNSQAFTVSGNGALYNFNYRLNKKLYQALSCGGKSYCLDCIYDLEITLTKDECSKIEYQNKVTVGTLTNLDFVCNRGSGSLVLPFNATLDIGSYTITKKLTVNKQAAEFYADSILKDPNNTCLKTIDDFYDEAWSKRDTTRCKTACAACNDGVKNSDSLSASQIANAAKECDSLWCNPKLATMCDMAKMSMINDLKPGGQYAIYKDANGNFNLGASPISIFNAANVSSKSIQVADPSIQTFIQNIPIILPNKPTQSLLYYMSTDALAQQLFNNWPDDLSEKLLPLHPEFCYLKYCDQLYVQQGNIFDTKLMNAATYADAQTAFGNAVIATQISSFYGIDDFYIGLPLLLQQQFKAKFTNYTGQSPANSIVQLALFATNCPSGNNINNCPTAIWGDAINADEEWQKLKAIYFSIKQEFLQKAREDYVQASGCCSNENIGCIKRNYCTIPRVWQHFPQVASNCNNNNWAYYGNAEKRFTTINDIDFPGVPNPTTSLYDMTPEEMAAYLQTDSIKSPCPTCPVLDAFKLMIWNLQNKKWIYNQSTVFADAILGLKDTLRQRIVGSQNNEPINIQLTNNGFNIQTNKCKIVFTADTTIDWGKAEIQPTCLDIQDYRNAKLHIIVNGIYKTILNIYSDCEMFYCDSLTTITPPPNGNCINPFEITFSNLTVFTSDLIPTFGNIVHNKFVIKNSITYGGSTTQFNSLTFVGFPQTANQVIVRKNTNVNAGKLYKISVNLMAINPTSSFNMPIDVVINNNIIATFNPLFNTWQNFNVNWVSATNTTITLELISKDINYKNLIAIDDFKMECLGDAAICTNPFIVNFDNNETYNSELLLSNSSIQLEKYVVTNNITASGLTINNTSNAMYAMPGKNKQDYLIIQKTASVTPNTNYILSFDGAHLSPTNDNTCFYLEVKINNVIVFSEQCLEQATQTWYKVYGWKNFSFNWNSGTNTTVTIEINSKKENRQSDIFGIDNLQMLCENSSGLISTRYIPISNCDSSAICNAQLPSPSMEMIPCDSILKDIATQQANNAYANYKDSVFNALLNGYYAKCMQSLETFTMDYTDAEYHYTLYYYDQSGNLVQTVPPAGVKPLLTAQLASVTVARNVNNGTQVLPAHFMKTNYNHNSLNAVVYQKTPDAGITKFWYDGLGRIALSQNAKQIKPINFPQFTSYTYYDKLGRTVEVGEAKINSVLFSTIGNSVRNYGLWQNFISSLPRTEITKTFYDNPYLGKLGKIDIAFGVNGQQNLRNRIGTVAYFANSNNLNANNYDHATHYNYDNAGNVTDLLQDFGTSSDFGTDASNVRTQSKHIAYSFDLVSGKVNQVNYQKGYADQFLYKYAYNADNKLTSVFTSTNGLIWENDARYSYYRHGPLARTELGTDKVQGIDYAYTLQGWIKGVNGKSIAPSQDIGQDGQYPSLVNIGYQNQNEKTAPDVFSYWLGYHKQDYKTIADGLNYIPAAVTSLQIGNYHNNPAELFNGNIRSMYTNIKPFGGLGMIYQYDQLNRIKKQDGFNVFANAPIANNAYSMALEYDPNGNIQKLLRNGTAATTAMDDLKYFYYNSNNSTYTNDPTSPLATNKLAYVTDAAGVTTETTDIENQLPNNYRYDAIGNLISDTKEGLNSIRWNLQNKITQINKANGITIGYKYDALGNRVFKKMQLAQGDYYSTYYVRDAQGNTLAIYEVKNNDTLAWTEQHIYGSARLGMYRPNKALLKLDIANNIQTTIPTALIENNSYRNTTEYELTSHLGNVLATITDSRTPSTLLGGAGGGLATLLTATDYYAFGMAIPDRKYSLNNTKIRYGFNGKENDGETGTQDYGFRIYNPALGRFLSVDPLTKDYPWYAPYQFAGNKPIQAIDIDGLEEYHIQLKFDKITSKAMLSSIQVKDLKIRVFNWSTFSFSLETNKKQIFILHTGIIHEGSINGYLVKEEVVFTYGSPTDFLKNGQNLSLKDVAIKESKMRIAESIIAGLQNVKEEISDHDNRKANNESGKGENNTNVTRKVEIEYYSTEAGKRLVPRQNDTEDKEKKREEKKEKQTKNKINKPAYKKGSPKILNKNDL